MIEKISGGKMYYKIITSINNGTLVQKLLKKIHHIIPIYYVDNKNMEFNLRVNKTLKKMKKKYHYLIENSIESKDKSEQSNKVWICWFQGEEKAPDLVKACINSIRNNMPDKEVIVLTNETIPLYVRFPEYIQKKWKSNKIPQAHYSDLLRVELLCKYGGMWIDATVLCTSNKIPECINDAPLFVYKQLDLVRLDYDPTVCSSWFISSYSNNNILLLTRKLLWNYWKKNSTLNNYFLFHIFFSLAARRYEEEWNKVPIYNNHSPHVLFFELNNKFNETRWNEIQKFSIFHKLNHHNVYSTDSSSFYKYILEINNR